jgi:phage terminase small subunit
MNKLKEERLSDKAEMAAHNYVTRGIIGAEAGYSWPQAMRDAGYTELYIRKNGYLIRRKDKVNELIEKTKAKLLKQNEIKASRVLKELKDIAFANADDYIDIDENGVVKLKAFIGINRDKLAAVESVKVLRNGITELKMASKLNALEQLGRHLGIYDRDNQQRSKPFVLVFNHKDKVKQIVSNQ